MLTHDLERFVMLALVARPSLMQGDPKEWGKPRSFGAVYVLIGPVEEDLYNGF
jgi:hypothetical protein